VVWAVRRSDKRLKVLEEAAEPVKSDAEVEAELRAKYAQAPAHEA
jgi:hypothetical protein